MPSVSPISHRRPSYDYSRAQIRRPSGTFKPTTSATAPAPTAEHGLNSNGGAPPPPRQPPPPCPAAGALTPAPLPFGGYGIHTLQVGGATSLPPLAKRVAGGPTRAKPERGGGCFPETLRRRSGAAVDGCPGPTAASFSSPSRLATTSHPYPSPPLGFAERGREEREADMCESGRPVRERGSRGGPHRPDFAALQEVVEPADAVPAIAIGFEQDAMPAAVVRLAVVFGQQVYEQLARWSASAPTSRDDLARAWHRDCARTERVVAPVVAQRQHRRVAGGRTVKSPQPISGTSLRMRMMRSVQLSSEFGSRRCSATLTCSKP